MKEGKKYHIDNDSVCQYEDERFVDDVTLLEDVLDPEDGYVLCEAKNHRATVLVPVRAILNGREL